MPAHPKVKRPSSSSQQGSSKKRKLNNGTMKKKPKAKEAKKEKPGSLKTIPIPVTEDLSDAELSEQDMEVLDEYAEGINFLRNLDQKGISKSKQEIMKSHELTKPVRQRRVVDDDLPSVNSHSSDEEDWSSEIPGDENFPSSDESDDDALSSYSSDPDAEMSYEKMPRKRRPSWDSDAPKAIQGLPIKLRDGKVRETGVKTFIAPEADSESEDEPVPRSPEPSRPVEDVSTGARFGRAGVANVLQTKSRKAKIELGKEQIASICQDILADPENSLGLIRRLHSFALATISTPTHPDPIPNDPIIRKLAILSQLAVFKDIIPGYRIRELTDVEKAEKVSQMVARTREWEQGLVMVYQTYLRLLESEIKARSELSEPALYSMCTLLTEATHFNFRTNLMTCIVARLSKKSWDKTSETCLNTLIRVFHEDMTGTASLEIVRLLNRMIKERHFKVHPSVLSCLLRLRLRTELGVRASDRQADKPETTKKGKSFKDYKERKAAEAQRVHLSKKAKKELKERKEIDKELREAEAVVDQEERKGTQTETLKLLFALYFRILKNPKPTRLLPSALSGISKFAHLVNIDFFKDLLQVLKDLISTEDAAWVEELEPESSADLTGSGSGSDVLNSIATRLMCIGAAFELLSGQGEALNIDLSEFISHLYALLLRLSYLPEIDQPLFDFGADEWDNQKASSSSQKKNHQKEKKTSIADMLFRILGMIFSPRTPTSLSMARAAPPWRSAAFAKRLLMISLHWPSNVTLRALGFVSTLVSRDLKLEAMLSTEDRIFNGVYRPDVDDPQLCQPFQSSFWELHVLRQRHWDPRVREEAIKLLDFKSS